MRGIVAVVALLMLPPLGPVTRAQQPAWAQEHAYRELERGYADLRKAAELDPRDDSVYFWMLSVTVAISLPPLALLRR